MNDRYAFHPARRFGLLFHTFVVILLLVIGVWGMWRTSQASIGPEFLSYLVISILAITTMPVFIYRAYALRGAYYLLQREGIYLHWGLRTEEIPINIVLWVRHKEEIEYRLPLPWIRWPGAVLGVRHLSEGTRLEFLAASSRQYIIIALEDRLYAISPEDPDEFLDTFHRLTELGSISPIQPRSIYPTFLLAQMWRTRAARYIILSGLLLNLSLLTWVSLVIPANERVFLGFATGGESVPVIRLLLLPILSGFIFLVDLFLGLFFFRRYLLTSSDTFHNEELAIVSGQTLAYMLWGSGTLTAILFLFAVFFILQAG